MLKTLKSNMPVSLSLQKIGLFLKRLLNIAFGFCEKPKLRECQESLEKLFCLGRYILLLLLIKLFYSTKNEVFH